LYFSASFSSLMAFGLSPFWESAIPRW
jgi:hypothetical protein